MKLNKNKKLGAGILILSIIQLCYNCLSLIRYIYNLIGMNNPLKTIGLVEPTYVIIIRIVLIGIVSLGIILILMKKKFGIYIYLTAEVTTSVLIQIYSILEVENYEIHPFVLIYLIVPLLMGIFIWMKKEAFAIKSKSEVI